MHSVRENNFREKDYVLLSSCLKKTNAARQKSVQIRRAHLTQSKSESKKKKKKESVLSVQSVGEKDV